MLSKNIAIFLTGLRSFSSSKMLSKKIEEFVVIGGGLMGAGIAQVIKDTL